MAPQIPLTIKDAAAAIRAGELTAVDLTRRVLERIERSQEVLGAYVTVLAEQALVAARAADLDLASGLDKGPLHGIPLAIKDIIATADAPTSANSRVYDPSLSGTDDAVVVARLRAAGAIVVGKSTTSEFALGMPDADKGFPIPRNPWHLGHSAGGSSSGTGIAVAAGLALGGLGSDTGGSVRFPAAANGHTGLKVTFGRVPKSGVVPLAYTLDTVGPMARTAYDCAVLLEVLAGHDDSDPYSARRDVPRYSAELDGDVSGLTIGVPMPYFFDADGLDDEVRDRVLDAIRVLKDAGATVVEVEVPHARRAKEANAITLGGEAFAYHRDDLVSRWSDYGKYTRPALIRGALLNAGDYAQAQRFRAYFCREVAKLFRTVDVLITPAWPVPAPRADDWGPERMINSPSFAAPWNLAGLPAAAVPCGFTADGLPTSMQIVGPAFAEVTVLRVADAYQRKTDWHLRVPRVDVLAETAE